MSHLPEIYNLMVSLYNWKGLLKELSWNPIRPTFNTIVRSQLAWHNVEAGIQEFMETGMLAWIYHM